MYQWSLDQWLHEHTYIIFYAGRLWYILGDVDLVPINVKFNYNYKKFIKTICRLLSPYI